MAYHDHEHCQVCGAHFSQHADLLSHTEKEHAQSVLPPRPQSQGDGQEDAAPRPRKNREFTRSHRE